MSNTETGSPAELPDFVDWSAADKEPSKFVTNMIVQVGETELSLLLFEVLTPYVQAPPNQPEKFTERWVAKLPIQATCHGRFILTPERCEQLIDLLQRQLTLYWDNWNLRYQEREAQRAASQSYERAGEEVQTGFGAEETLPEEDEEL